MASRSELSIHHSEVGNSAGRAVGGGWGCVQTHRPYWLDGNRNSAGVDQHHQFWLYYLTGDVTLTENEAWKPADGVVLCLNGHSITSERSVNSIIVKQSVTFTLTDCKGIGTIPNFNIAIWHGGLSLIVSKQHEKAATPCEPVMMSLPNFIFG